MNVQNVTSSAISAIGYDPGRELLEVRFHTGRIYHYHNVPQSMYDRLMTARSHGTYFNRAIRDRFRAELVYDPEGT
jgi:KTSC domain